MIQTVKLHQTIADGKNPVGRSRKSPHPLIEPLCPSLQALREMEDAAASGMAPIMYDAEERMIYEAA